MSAGATGPKDQVAAETWSEGEADSLLHAVHVLRERWWVVALCVVLGMGAAAGLAVTRPDVFESSASVLFGRSQLSDSALGVQRDSAQPERDAATQVLVATSPDVTDRVRKALTLEASRDEVLGQMTVEAEDNANVLTFTAAAEDPEEAARLANAYADQYADFNRDSEIRELDGAIKAQEAQLGQSPPGSPERAELDARLNTSRALRAAAVGGVERIGTAEVPTARSAPQPKRDAVIGAILGLVLGLTLAFLIDLFDRRIKTVEDFERLYLMRALASIPQVSFDARSQAERAVGFEPYRVLRNAIGFAEMTQELNTIMVTSAMPAEGKSSVAANLARAIALSGQRVVLVECDLRKPSLTRHLGLQDPGGGLTTALVGRRPVSELLRAVTPGLLHFSVLPSGPLPPNAAELLRSHRMGALLEELTADGTRLVLDAPPLLPVADAQGMLDHPQIDAAIIVARTFQTTRNEVRRARAVLDQHRLQPLGIVVTGLKEERSYGYYGMEADDGASVPPDALGRSEPEPAGRR